MTARDKHPKAEAKGKQPGTALKNPNEPGASKKASSPASSSCRRSF